MIDEDESELDRFLQRDQMLPHVTAEAVGESLLSFPLQSDRPLGWIAMAVRRALSLTMRDASKSVVKKSPKDVRDELSDLATETSRIWVKCFERSNEADERLWDHAFKNWEGTNALLAIEDPQFPYNRYRSALRELEWLTGFLRSAGQSTEVPRGNWKGVELKRVRIDRAYCLAPIFEATFGHPAQANNWPSDPRHSKTPFMQFYQSMVGLAFEDWSDTNLSDVVKAACQEHRRDPIRYEDSFIPDIDGAESSR